MSREYDNYLEQHKENVRKGYEWIRDNLPEVVSNIPNLEWQICLAHDESKTKPDEYEAYDRYFYGNNRSYKVVQNFNYAWLNHLHRNPHHWQYWILINDDPELGEIIMDMPINYIIEMICDWWAFSWDKGDLMEMFKWYDERKNYIKLSEKSRREVESILGMIKEKLSDSNDTENKAAE